MSFQPVRKRFSASQDELEAIRDFLSVVGTNAGLDRGKIYKLCLAADEIATNIIVHGFMEEGVEDGHLEIDVHVDNGTLVTTLIDAAVAFNPINRAMPTEEDLALPPEERPIGGLGIMMAKNSVDEYVYKHENGMNKNILVMKLK
jgi:serine/threonine-protein kinase RsbW